MKIINLTGVNSFFANTYLYVNNGEAMLVDAAASPDSVRAALESEGATLKLILLTHGHYDHVVYLNELKNTFDVPVTAGLGEDVILTSPTANVSALFGKNETYLPAEVSVCENDKISVGSSVFSVISTPGHTPGSICLYCESENILFSGDTLFADGIGRTDFEYGSYSEIMKSLSKLANLPENTEVFPGHGEGLMVNG